MSNYFTQLSRLQNSKNWRFGDLHYLSPRSPSGGHHPRCRFRVFPNEDSKNALTKEMVDIASMMKEKLTGCQQQKPKKSGFSFSVCHCQLTKFFTTYFCLQHSVWKSLKKVSFHNVANVASDVLYLNFHAKHQLQQKYYFWRETFLVIFHHCTLEGSFLQFLKAHFLTRWSSLFVSFFESSTGNKTSLPH